jgi:hypothetical protein
MASTTTQGRNTPTLTFQRRRGIFGTWPGVRPAQGRASQKNLREMLNPMYQFVPSGPPRAICPIVVPKESEKFS